MNRTLRRHVPQRGVSLIEALAALAVMAFGLLGVVGMQATLRSNGDVSKQRSEAVRMAQEQIEDWRSFERLTAMPGPPAVPAFADIGAVAGSTVTGYTTNATYTRSAAVDNASPGPDDPKLKSMKIDVSWSDRRGDEARVQLVSAIAGVAPELAGSLSLPADRAATQRPGGRHVAIPPGAVAQSGADSGKSWFSPPGTSNVRWVFNNQTGFITTICDPLPTCTDTMLLPLSGFVQFATGAVQPTGANAENPSSASEPISMKVAITLPTTADVLCFTQAFPTYVTYFCAMPLTTALPRRWSGRTLVLGLAISPSLADVTVTNRKVCRYTPSATHTPAGGNRSHPLDYVDVTEPLANQNFLVISGGNGSVAFDCPPDDAGTEFVNGTTYRHQPDA